ncbi:poly-beta-1,6-N-acetyl-D-glucosamine biosynthesis protein PgaD, partial [Achromobacter ruhlandii]|nr:poly-beta-1,6-N-acetyl-D-glucosamine biosynthesis protein PgaD [Achromobacter ruhlandii]
RAVALPATPRQPANWRAARAPIIHPGGDGEIQAIEAARPRLAAVPAA